LFFITHLLAPRISLSHNIHTQDSQNQRELTLNSCLFAVLMVVKIDLYVQRIHHLRYSELVEDCNGCPSICTSHNIDTQDRPTITEVNVSHLNCELNTTHKDTDDDCD
jgi:hypothetical protein